MKKILLIILLLPLICHGEWQYIKKTSYGDVYWDNATVQKNKANEYYVAVLTDFGVRQKGIDRLIEGKLVYDTHFKPLSSKTAYLIHCQHQKSALLGEVHYSEKMGKGKKIFSEVESNPNWMEEKYIDIDKIFPTLRMLVCN